ncbi:hypothetical protein ASPSYDRAFT_83650 [Aspergillus sydowii CBS 593.65]|uniref:beta-glucosidase n=1 Tax=Aspergillus sydowii CBS 593.65 TaxID=1036612 RepID=A0A1L9TVX8_9EURO|nr:uncharacterized protein ASPSYDRAFT_83650 [Aspergillus sydowii CBS 593.65]OJJ63597.1 hypothetical protein ASPSYDRAFT_83650 [Aspergillus sydowii CBS 593.65]
MLRWRKHSTGSCGTTSKADVCLVFLKNWHEELVARRSLNLDWTANDLVEAIASNCNNTIVITHSGGVNVLPWANHPNVTTVLATDYPGEQSGNAITDILYRKVNPSAKLPYTIAYKGERLCGVANNLR